MGSTVLVVDDDPYIREALQDLLVDEGYRVLLARDGSEALAVLGNERPCLVLLDIMMPVMDGLTFLRHLQASPSIRDVPVALMTAAAARVPPLVGLPLINKPIEIHSLLDLVRQHCEPDTAADDATPGPPGGQDGEPDGGLDCSGVRPRIS